MFVCRYYELEVHTFEPEVSKKWHRNLKFLNAQHSCVTRSSPFLNPFKSNHVLEPACFIFVVYGNFISLNANHILVSTIQFIIEP